jgi:hypothetical protein
MTRGDARLYVCPDMPAQTQSCIKPSPQNPLELGVNDIALHIALPNAQNTRNMEVKVLGSILTQAICRVWCAINALPNAISIKFLQVFCLPTFS